MLSCVNFHIFLDNFVLFALMIRSTDRSPSLELVWPESPRQPTTTAGQPGELSPRSFQFLSLVAADQRAHRQVAVKQAWHLHTDRSSRSIGIAEKAVISIDRQAKR